VAKNKRRQRPKSRREHAAELPTREAMSLLGGSIMGGGLTPDLMGGAVPDTGLTETEPTEGGATPSASTTDLANLTQAIAAEQAASAPGTASSGGVNVPQGEATSASST
jgi:hypothetical protein